MADSDLLATLKRLRVAEAKLHRIEDSLEEFHSGDLSGSVTSVTSPDGMVRRISALIEKAVRTEYLEHELALRETATVDLRAVLLWMLPRRIVGVLHRIWRIIRKVRSGNEVLSRGAPPMPAVEDRNSACVPASLELHALSPPDPIPTSASQTRIAVICDPFTAQGLEPACICGFLAPDTWRTEMVRMRPHLLFVESAWTGLQGEWTGQVSGAADELLALVESCKAVGIPTVFWNKEDPLHFEAFLESAKQFDLVCTTDAGSIARYKRELGHDRVHLLPFAIQPLLHNPVMQPGESRELSSFFAGAWYGRQPERCRNFDDLAHALSLVGKLRIFDRNSGTTDPQRRYPVRYRQSLEACVDYTQTPGIHRRHRIGLTLNTIKHSPTMFARRAIELMATNTSVYSNHSWALQQMFGDLVIATDDGDRVLEKAFEEFSAPDSMINRARRLAALRKVLKEYTWTERLEWLLGLMGVEWNPNVRPTIAILTRAANVTDVCKIDEMAAAQQGVEVQVWVLAPTDIQLSPRMLRLTPQLAMQRPDEALGSALLAPWHPEDAYGRHYLEDLCLARKFGQGTVVGKAGRFDIPGQSGLRPALDLEYRKVERLALRRSLMDVHRWPHSIQKLLDELEEGFIEGDDVLSADGLHYRCRGSNGAWEEDAALIGVDQGKTVDALRLISHAIPEVPVPWEDDGGDVLDGTRLAELFQQGHVPTATSATPKRKRLELVSLLPSGREDALFSSSFARETIERDGRLALCLDGRPHPGVDFYLDALDSNGEVVRRDRLPAEVNVFPSLDEKTSAYRFAIAAKGSFVTHVDGVWLQGRRATPMVLAGHGRLLVVVNGYPSIESLYRNAFIHRRILAYKARGVGVDVVWVSTSEQPRTFEFDGVGVVVCGPDALRATLEISGHVAIAVHFLDATLWDAVRVAASRIRTVVWLHGSEIQPWTRRAFNIRSTDEGHEAIRSSDARMGFWRGMLSAPPDKLHLVFVSRSFAEQAWEDVGLRLDEDRWSVIPNPIDADLFVFEPKEGSQRFKVLSIRPHTSRIYANDIVAEAIRILSTRTDFNRWQFYLVGDGLLWEENFASLDHFPNVHLERCFLRQEEIADLHRRHGVFLVPTRGDTQGVSRDEAMASGLVPVTTDAGSVSEFVDGSCAFVCPPEDAGALASALVDIAADPVRFKRMSTAANSCIASRSVGEIIPEEIRMLGLRVNASELTKGKTFSWN